MRYKEFEPIKERIIKNNSSCLDTSSLLHLLSSFATFSRISYTNTIYIRNKTVCCYETQAINYIRVSDIRNDGGVVNYFTACCHSFSWEIARAIKIQPTTLVCKQIVIIYQHYRSYDYTFELFNRFSN